MAVLVYALRDKDTHDGAIYCYLKVNGKSEKEDIESAICRLKSEVDDYGVDHLEKYMPDDVEVISNDYDDEIWW